MRAQPLTLNVPRCPSNSSSSCTTSMATLQIPAHSHSDLHAWEWPQKWSSSYPDVGPTANADVAPASFRAMANKGELWKWSWTQHVCAKSAGYQYRSITMSEFFMWMCGLHMIWKALNIGSQGLHVFPSQYFVFCVLNACDPIRTVDFFALLVDLSGIPLLHVRQSLTPHLKAFREDALQITNKNLWSPRKSNTDIFLR